MIQAIRYAGRLAVFGVAVLVWTSHFCIAAEPATPVWRSPYQLTVSPDGNRLYITDRTAGCVVVADAVTQQVVSEIPLQGEPCGLCLTPDGQTLYVAERVSGTVAIVDTATAKVTGRIAVDLWPFAVALAPQSKRLYVGCTDSHCVCVVDLAAPEGKILAKIKVVREPVSIAVTPDEKLVVVANLLPDGVGTDPKLAADVSILDTASLTQSATIKLPPGSTSVNGICVSPDGKWAYAVHTLGRFNLPITQLERGWVNTYSLSVIELATAKRIATVLLDDLTQGAASPFGVVCSRDGSCLWISHCGTHEVSFLNVAKLHELLAGKVSDDVAAMRDGSQSNVWLRIQQDPAAMAELENDLTALYIAGAVRRVASGGNGPRGIALSPDGQKLYVANYYAGSVGILDASTGKTLGKVALPGVAEPTGARRGEMLFHDATLSFQRWQSCATCHPNQGRVDGLRWDFLRDGIGNGKDTISLLLVDETPPLNRRATRLSAKECARSSVEAGHMIVPSNQDVEDLYSYLKSLRAEPSPHLNAQKGLSEPAQRGKLLFEGKADCTRCHPQPYFTDLKSHNVGVLSPSEPDGLYDTPTLIEAYRTAPYLHDGRARTLREVLTVHNSSGQHGKTAELNESELQDLEMYLLSL